RSRNIHTFAHVYTGGLHPALILPRFPMHVSSGLPRRGAAVVVAALTLAAALAACGKSEAPAPAAGGAAPPPAEVGVITVQPGDVGLVTELPGRLEASRVAEVRARAAGILQRRMFRE